MKESIEELAERLLHTGIDALSEQERHVLTRLKERAHISLDIHAEFEKRLSFGERLADRVAELGGSWTFIAMFGVLLAGWVALNSFILFRNAFDPFPYVFLNLILSMLAAIQAPIIMMAQNRQAAKDRLAAAHDYEVNLKAEFEIMSLHEKFDQLRNRQMTAMLQSQEEQIRLLTTLVSRADIEAEASG